MNILEIKMSELLKNIEQQKSCEVMKQCFIDERDIIIK